MAGSNSFGWADNSKSIDTTPANLPQPPSSLIEAAAKAVPPVMADITPRSDGEISLVASALVKALHKQEHTAQAACWAIHSLVSEGKLLAKPAYDPIPTVVQEDGNTFGGGYSVRPIPQDKPTPINTFRVVATDSLWSWWREIDGNTDRVKGDNFRERQNTFGRIDSAIAVLRDSSSLANGADGKVLPASYHHLFQEHITEVISSVLMGNCELSPEQDAAFRSLESSLRFDREAWLLIVKTPGVKQWPPVNIPPELAYDPALFDQVNVALRNLVSAKSADGGSTSQSKLELVTASTELPVSVEDMKQHVRLLPESTGNKPVILSREHFEKAKEVAVGCLWKGNAIIKYAINEPRMVNSNGKKIPCFELAAHLQQFCDFLDDGRYAIDRVRDFLLLAVDQPVRHGNLTRATTHALAWDFAHNLWVRAHNVLYEYWVLRPEGIPESDNDGTFQLDRDSVDANVIKIRDSLRGCKQIDARYMQSQIQIESQKAFVAFESRQISVTDRTSLKQQDIDNKGDSHLKDNAGKRTIRAGEAYFRQLSTSPEGVVDLWRCLIRLKTFALACKPFGELNRLEKEAINEHITKEMRELRENFEQEFNKCQEEFNEEIAAEEKTWEATYKHPYPHTFEDWERLLARAGMSLGQIIEGKHTQAEVIAGIEGYLLRIQDGSQKKDIIELSPKGHNPEVNSKSTGKKKSRKGIGGKPRLSVKEVKRRKEIIDDWSKASAAGTKRYDFCSDKGISRKELNTILTWDSARRRRKNDG